MRSLAVQREQLFLKQKGKCHWCGVHMTPALPPRRCGDPPRPKTMCTLDHVYNKLDPRRRQPHKANEVRRVAACFRCNVKRGKKAEIEYLKKGRSERFTCSSVQ